MEYEFDDVGKIPNPAVKPGEYTQLLRDFVASGKRLARVKSDKSAERLADSLADQLKKGDFEGVRVYKRGDAVFLENTNIGGNRGESKHENGEKKGRRRKG